MQRQQSQRGGWMIPGTSRRSRSAMQRRRAIDLGGGLGPEALEVRTLLSGQAVQLVKDVNTIESHPSQLTPVGSNLFFVVQDGTGTGTELVVENASGTQVLKDVSSTASYGGDGISSLTAVGGSLFFTDSESTESTLWTSDGTVAGTQQVTLTNAGSPTSQLGSLFSLGNTLVFTTTSYSTATDHRLWAAGAGSTSATMLKDFGVNTPEYDGEANGTLYISIGGNLWLTGGTANTTQELFDSSSKPLPVPQTVFGFAGQAYYLTASTSSTTSPTLGTLGTGGETAAITGLPPGISDPVVSGSHFYFAASSTATGSKTQLWVSDGTQANTRMVEDFSSISATSGPTDLVDAGGHFFFSVKGSDGQAQLWQSGGTAQSTAIVKDLGTTGTSAYSGYNYGSGGYGYYKYVPVGGSLYFMAYDATNGAALWSTTLATGTTQLVAHIDPQDMVDWNGQLAFAANDGSTPPTSQLWTSGGTAATTTKVASFPNGTTQGSAGGPGLKFVLGSQLLLPLDDGISGTALWATDGTAAGTKPLVAVAPIGFAGLNAEAYFLGTSHGSLGLWTTDGTTGGTTEVKDLSAYRATYGYGQSHITSAGGRLYFATSDANQGVDLWVSDGTSGGTSIVKDLPALAGSSDGNSATIDGMTAFGSKLAFLADSGSTGTQVWITDGTAGGTQMLTDIPGSSGGYGHYGSTLPSSLTVVGGTLYFTAGSATDPSAATGLWSSDGTAGHTSEFFAFPTIPTYSSGQSAKPGLANLTAVGTSLFLSANYSYYDGTKNVNTSQLWTSNGTAAGTFQIPASDGGTLAGLSGFLALWEPFAVPGHRQFGRDGALGIRRPGRRDQRDQGPEFLVKLRLWLRLLVGLGRRQWNHLLRGHGRD